MMKIRKFIALLLAGLTIFSFTACKGEGAKNNSSVESSSSDISDSSSTDNNELEKEYVGAEENQDIPSTGQYIIENGKTDYIVVYSQDAGADILSAISELNLFVSEATNGVEFVTTTDENVMYSNTAKYISLGQNKFWQAANIPLEENLGKDGLQMVTKGNSVFLFGNTEKAALYAVYDFLYYTLDFDYMYKDVYSLDKNVENVELKQYNLVNIPDIPIRAAGYGWIDSDSTMMNRMRSVGLYSPLLNVNGAMIHNSFRYVEDYVAGHEGYWIGTCGNQLCYTARGDKEEYEALQNACLESLKTALKADLNASMVGLTQEDHNAWCSCEACKTVTTEYGAKSAILVLFMNDLRAKLDAWFATEEGQPYYRDMDLVFFSYHQTNSAPAHYDETTGQYVANNGIHCNDGVAVWFAPIEADFTHSLLDEQNESALAALRGWEAVSDKMYLWMYSGPFANYMVWYNSFDGMQDTYRLAKEFDAQYLFDQAQYGPCTVPFAWGALKSYLNCKLAWNVDVDIVKLTDKFFEAAYGPVAEEMKTYYFEQRVYLTWLSNNTDYSCSRSCSNGDIGNASFWPKPVLTSWLDDINAIIDKLEDVRRANPELYEFYYNNVALERLSVYAQLVDLYEYNTSSDLIMEYKLQFVEDATELGIGYTEEPGRILSDIMAEWGL